MKTNKKIKEYLKRSVRKLKHRKGYGVHSPFAFAIITEVIEEKTPYYAYQRMRRTYDENRRAPASFKVACLLLRLANRFRARTIVEVECDGGYSLLPLMLVDTRNRLFPVGDEAARSHFGKHFAWVGSRRLSQVTFVEGVGELPDGLKADMFVLNGIPKGMDVETFVAWIDAHATERTVFWVKGIRPDQRLEALWDALCDRDDIAITMDLYDYGLAIRKPRFFKQHYVVAF